MNQAVAGLEKLKENVDLLLSLSPNDKLIEVVEERTTMREAFLVVDEDFITRCSRYFRYHCNPWLN